MKIRLIGLVGHGDHIAALKMYLEADNDTVNMAATCDSWRKALGAIDRIEVDTDYLMIVVAKEPLHQAWVTAKGGSLVHIMPPVGVEFTGPNELVFRGDIGTIQVRVGDAVKQLPDVLA